MSSEAAAWGYDGLDSGDDEAQGYGFAGQGWSGPSIGAIGAFTYAPSLGPVGSGSAYYPGDVSQDARALAYLGYLPEVSLSTLVGTSGSQSSDMANQTGAWTPDFRDAVFGFQGIVGLVSDSWIGPKTRAALAAAVAAKNAQGGGVAPPPTPVVPGSPVSPVIYRPEGEDNTKTYLLLGGGAVALLAVGYFLLK